MKRFYTIILIALFGMHIFAQIPNWQWAKSAGDIGYEFSNSVATDLSGNVYVTGSFQGSTLDFGNVILINTDSSGISEDVFLVKYDASGKVLWAKSARGYGLYDKGNSVATDMSGNVYLIGSFSGPTLDFGNTTLTNFDKTKSTTDVFIVKYDANGNLIWAKSAGSKYYERGTSITIDVSGYVYITGSFSSDTLVFGSTILANPNNKNFSTDMFLVKCDPNGNVIWAKSAGGNNSDNVHSVTTDLSGNVYLTGSYQSPTLVFDSIELKNEGMYNDDLFLVKYNSNGNAIWARKAGADNSFDYGASIVADASGNVYVTGLYSSFNIVFGKDTLASAGTNNLFLAKYDPNGNVLWAKKAEGSGIDFGTGLATDFSGNLYLTGSFGTPTIGFGNTTLVNAGSYNMFIVKYDPNGNVLWAKSSGGNGEDISFSVATDNFGNAYSTGIYNSSILNFGSTVLKNANSETLDIFLAKLSTTVGTSESKKENQIIIYPNPFSSQTTISFSEPLKNATLKILDVFGNEIETISFTGKQVILEKGKMTNGIYFLQIVDEKNHVVNKKMVIQ